MGQGHSHPDAKEGGHRTFENKETVEKLRHDEAKPGSSGHRGESHWHRFNPNSKNRFDEYLDANNIPVPRNSPESHLYPKIIKGIKMDISKYTDYFHDGYVNNIWHVGNDLFISLESSVIEDISQIQDSDCISEAHTFKGTLNLINIKKFVLGNKKYEGIYRMEYDDGDILDFEIKDHTVFLLIEWKNFPPKIRNVAVSKIKIEAERIE